MKLHHRLQRLSLDRRLQTANEDGEHLNLPSFHLKTVADVLLLLEEQVRAVRGDEEASALEKARTVGYLAVIALRTIETGNLAARIEMLELVLSSSFSENLIRLVG
jgi:hypothetical protein